jgi:hypothetical protein
MLQARLLPLPTEDAMFHNPESSQGSPFLLRYSQDMRMKAWTLLPAALSVPEVTGWL